MKRCPGYTSPAGGYAQGPHQVADDATHFSPGKSQCRDCYRAYAADWRAKRAAAGAPVRRPTARATRPVIVMPDFRAPALSGSDDEELVSVEDAERSHAYVPAADLIETWGSATRAVENGGMPANLIFLGPPGCGKTEGAAFLAALVGLPYTKVDAPSITDPEGWFGTREVVERDGVPVTTYRPSAFVQAIERPGVVLVDEFNRMRDEGRQIVLGLMDTSRQVTNPLTGDVVVRHPRCFLIMSGNRGLQFTGTSNVDPAFFTRALTVQFDYVGAEAERKIAVDSTGCDEATAELFVRFAAETRARARTNVDFLPVSTREVIAACEQVANGSSADTAARVAVINAASPEGEASSVQAGLEAIWAGIRRVPAVEKTTCGAVHPVNAAVVCAKTVTGGVHDVGGGIHQSATDVLGNQLAWW